MKNNIAMLYYIYAFAFLYFSYNHVWGNTIKYNASLDKLASRSQKDSK